MPFRHAQALASTLLRLKSLAVMLAAHYQSANPEIQICNKLLPGSPQQAWRCAQPKPNRNQI
jgi:hypothetical protein